ncbi:MAG TPA: TlpA family protein disulfide reductase [Candidatus Cryptobacteroides merdipullorum]|uniref:TlpA family protein disulfide reductase n=1 Tax=Candidatus Cryptobacteroides merdipullorum TaxID=2840771 RepID=A0A9D1GMP8_9BACT|nr:TlpA family protein disulfide reductase [Candidatus Cryptobacteroides merdipullorum]
MYATMKHLMVPFTLLTLASCIRESSPDGPELGPGDRLPEFNVTLDDGSALGTSDLSGEVSVIVFFNTGCPDCRMELPVIQRIYEDFGTRTSVVCISREQKQSEIEAYWHENGFSVPYSAQEDRRVYGQFSRTGIPKVYVSGSDLTIHSVYDDDPVASYDDLAGDIQFLKN